MEGTYTMSLNQLKKEMNIKIIGNFTPEQAKRFMDDYNKNVNSINAADFNLVLDCLELAIVTPELVPALEDCYKLYKSSNFNKVIFEISNKPIVKMQLNRIAKKVGLDNAEIVIR
ncbi:hypothetical protein CW357_11560 [Rummeliibacillus sp. TYF005]|uniref:hypothetical protein n=1 Tax=Rummeliibacillus sp. TYF005 TaxID=2058214 RepID=UPI000F528896|nr:hypothetical protein [Rummeliibacillus sp. TYF005]RPJ95243.1 hypothetical protein CW357_11560 [Rummeliibacillus sp. TYF005]